MSQILKDITASLNKAMAAVDIMDIEGVSANTQSAQKTLIRATQTAALLARECTNNVLYTAKKVYEESVEKSWSEDDFFVTAQGDEVIIHAPAILPNQTRDPISGRKFIPQFFRDFLMTQCVVRDRKYARRERVVVVIDFIRPANAIAFDYDNTDYKQFVDVLAGFFLMNDCAQNIDVFNRFLIGQKSKTVFHILPKDGFIKWVSEYYGADYHYETCPPVDKIG
ncbi:MAG: DUF6100 family protein [Smithellaceae bacterium]|nr:DUF6100 family protein [Smithellaceae bacterium]